MENRSANAFLLHLVKCLKREGVTNHAIRQGFKQANLTAHEITVSNSHDRHELEDMVVGLATAYYALEKQ